MSVLWWLSQRTITAILLSLVYLCLVGPYELHAVEQENTLPTKAEIDFTLIGGKQLNHFFRNEQVAVHSVFSTGDKIRAIFSFPAGNSGLGLWFDSDDENVRWGEPESTIALERSSSTNQSLWGIQGEITLHARKVAIKQVLLSSNRVLRDYGYSDVPRKEIEHKRNMNGAEVSWFRQRLDGKSAYQLSLQVLSGKWLENAKNELVLMAATDGPIRLKYTALSGDPPLTPMQASKLFAVAPEHPSLADNILTFLSYEEKFLAGSWRFATYFGRDTLLSLRMLLPRLSADAIESAFGSVITRMLPNGSVAHEEDIGEFAVLRHKLEQNQNSDSPIYDYKMIDDDYLLTIVFAQYVDAVKKRGDSASWARLKQFLSRRTMSGRSYAQQLKANAEWVVASAKPYASSQEARDLIHLKKHEKVGQWRDSEEGLAGGRVPYDVNVVLLPAALEAIEVLLRSGVFDGHTLLAFPELKYLQQRWVDTGKYFRISVSQTHAEHAQQRYRQSIGWPKVSSGETLSGSLVFMGIALDENYKAIPVIHSDIGYALLFTKPESSELKRMLAQVIRPFPQGLFSPVGLIVANPVYASQPIQQSLNKFSYHGTVIWSWQQALLNVGLMRQLERADLNDSTLSFLHKAKTSLDSISSQQTQVKASELWSWAWQDDQLVPTAFGQRVGDKTESNAAQLWSAVP